MIPTSHPYYPEGVLLSGNSFIANTWSVPTLILIFATACTSLLVVTLAVLRYAKPTLKLSDQWKVLWFILSESAKFGR
jgi:cholestenol Delta-isomerase